MRGGILLAVLACTLSGCAATPASNATPQQVAAAADLLQLGQIVRLAAAAAASADVASGSVGVALDEAGNGLVADAAALRGGNTPHAAAAHLALALPSLRALQAGCVVAGPAQARLAGRTGTYLDAFLLGVSVYDADAPAAGLPAAALPNG